MEVRGIKSFVILYFFIFSNTIDAQQQHEQQKQQGSTVVEDGSCNKTCIILVSSGTLALFILCLALMLYYAVCKDKDKGKRDRSHIFCFVSLKTFSILKRKFLVNKHATLFNVLTMLLTSIQRRFNVKRRRLSTGKVQIPLASDETETFQITR